MLPIGRHALVECRGPISELDVDQLEILMTEAAQASGATVLKGEFHPFGEGQGVTGVLILSESHITVHTWPEHGYAAFDAFMCGDCDPGIAAKIIADHPKTESAEIQLIERGFGLKPFDTSACEARDK